MTLLNIFVAWHSWLFSRSFSVCLPRFSARPSSRCIFYPVAFLSWSSFSSLVLSRLPSSRYFSPLPEEACVVSTTAYTIRSACAKANLRKPWKLDGLIFKFDQVVLPPSGLRSCSLSLELFQFPVRRYLNIWRFWSFWFICRKYGNILVKKNLLCIILSPIKADVSQSKTNRDLALSHFPALFA